MNHVFRYFMSYLKSLTTTQNYLNYFKDNIFSTFFFQICKDGSFKTSKTKNKQLKNSTNNFKRINISVNEMGKFEKKELTKYKTFTKRTCYSWYDCLINYIYKLIKKSGLC